MKLSKVLAASAVVSAMALTATVSALAADAPLTAALPTDGIVTVPVSEVADYVTALDGKDATYVVLLAYGDAAATFESDKFLQIGQGSLAELINGNNYEFVIPADLASKAEAAFGGDEYDATKVKVVVRIGGLESGFLEGVFAPFAKGEDSPYENPDRFLGDVDDNEMVEATDIQYMLFYLNDWDDTVINNVDAASAADVDGNCMVEATDIQYILFYLNDWDTSLIDEDTFTLSTRTAPCEDY